MKLLAPNTYATAADRPGTDDATPVLPAALPDPATNPLGHLQAISGQIQSLIKQGPNTLQANAGHDLQNAVTGLESTLASAQQNAGKKQWRNLLSGISDAEQRISDDAAVGQISRVAADALTGELQQLADELPTNGG